MVAPGLRGNPSFTAQPAFYAEETTGSKQDAFLKAIDSAISNNDNPKKTDDPVLEVEIEIEDKELGDSEQEV
eukprot:12931473-Prorocentrum_lima.AAC.1